MEYELRMYKEDAYRLQHRIESGDLDDFFAAFEVFELRSELEEDCFLFNGFMKISFTKIDNPIYAIQVSIYGMTTRGEKRFSFTMPSDIDIHLWDELLDVNFIVWMKEFIEEFKE